MFLGGNAVWAAVGCAFLDFSRHRRFWYKIEMQPTSERLFLFVVGFNGRLGQSSLSRLVAPGRSFKL